MAAPTGQVHQNWSSRFTFIMAAVGSAVGLGNFWRFPYETGNNGGGAFVIVYLGCVLLVAMPLVICELTIGRRGGLSAVGSTRKVAIEAGGSRFWSITGWVGMIGAFLILSFYSVIAGWIIQYIPMLASGAFAGGGAERTAEIFDELLSNVSRLIWGHSIFMGLTIFIVWRGLLKGIEWVVSVLMPSFFVLLAVLAVYSLLTGDAAKAISFMFTPDFSKITGRVAVSALGHAFFPVGVGVGIMLTYGAYLKKDEYIPHSGAIIALSDTAVAIVAGLLIFPIVFEYGLDPAAGPGLIFVTLPVAFGQMPFGALIGTAFFILALVAAITSSISMLEIFVSWAQEHRGLKRHSATILGGGLAWAVGLITIFSFNIWKDVRPLGFVEGFADMTPFDLIDYFAGKVMLPIGGLLVALLSGWIISNAIFKDETGWRGGAYTLWRFLVKFLAPIAVLSILVAESGLLDFLWSN